MTLYVYLNADMDRWDPDPFEDAEWRVKIDQDEFDLIFEEGEIPHELHNFKRRKRDFVLSLEQEVFLPGGVEGIFWVTEIM